MLDSKVKAPEFPTNLPWINVNEPLSIESLKGKIVLLDFWTFCCSDCMHIIPYLKKLEREYADYLVVIGVHTAKFDNEGSSENIKQAVFRYGIEHPVVCDRAYAIWERYFIREWPTLVLIDPEGNVVERVPCSKKPYGKFEAAIEALIHEYAESGMLNSRTLPQIQIQAETQSSLLRFPGKVTADPVGERIFISDSGHNRIVIADSSGKVIDLIGSGLPGSKDGEFADCTLRGPQGLCLKEDKLFIADTDNHLIRIADLTKRQLTTIAGNGVQGLYSTERMEIEDGSRPALKAPLSSPWDLLLYEEKLFIAMAGTHQIWCMDLKKESIEIFAGTGRESLVDGDRRRAQLSQPSGLTLLDNKLYFVDSETSAVRFVDFNTDIVTTVVGEGLFAFGDKDGSGKEVRLQHPLAVCTYEESILIADSYNHKIKSLTPLNSEVRTISGTGKPGRDLSTPQYWEPGGLAASKDTLLIADTNNHRIVKMKLSDFTVDEFSLSQNENQDKVPTLPNLHIVECSPSSLPEEELIPIELLVDSCNGYHLNETMPIEIYFLDCPSFILAEGKRSMELTGTRKFQLRTRTRAATQNANESELNKIAAVVYYCSEGDSSACFVKSFQIEFEIGLLEKDKQPELERKKSELVLSVSLL